MLEGWVTAVEERLGLDHADLDLKQQLDIARVVAHRVERRAAPVTALLIGLAAGRAGGSPEAVAGAGRKVMELARAWSVEEDSRESPNAE
jgi:hypothetical protein